MHVQLRWKEDIRMGYVAHVKRKHGAPYTFKRIRLLIKLSLLTLH